MNTNTLSPLGSRLVHLLGTVEGYDQSLRLTRQEQTFHVQNTGHIVSSLYEQLRNASEYTEEHLLLQRATRRFYSRSLQLIDQTPPKNLAEELITELTLAEYITNDSVTLDQISQMNDLIHLHVRCYWSILASENAPSAETTKRWIYDMLAVRTEHILHHPIRMVAYLNFAYTHYAQSIDVQKVPDGGESLDDHDRNTVLYLAIHKALLKSDPTMMRSMLIDLFGTKIDDTNGIIAINRQFDRLIELKTTDKLTRFINKNGAPLRIVRRAFFDDNSTAKASLLSNRKQVSTLLRQTIEDEYRDTRMTLNRGIVKSIVFLIITKAVIGLAIEIPYDLAVYNHIAWLPLVINLFFPAVFIALTTLMLATPGEANTTRIVQTIDELLYGDTQAAAQQLRVPASTRHSTAFTVAYALLFIAVLGAVVQGLLLIEFNVVQILIFIIFLSTAAFLGYRLSLQVKALEMVTTEASFFSVVRDFLYTPFIFIGHQISSRYAKINLVARLLDNAIELPLKTTLRLMRQWTTFLSNKKDEIL